MSNPGRKYDREFKIEAVKLVARGDKTQAQIARDLGVSAHQLAYWRQQQAADARDAFPGKGHLKPADEELRKLPKELRDVTEQRDILKKPSPAPSPSLGYLSPAEFERHNNQPLS